MTPEEVRTVVLCVLCEIAPEADLAAIQPAVGFRDRLDLDSMDVLNFVVGLRDALGVEIPEGDYPKRATLEYLVVRRPRAGRVSQPDGLRGEGVTWAWAAG
jgi:acyl carrier protein